jgi:hypothetical protein
MKRSFSKKVALMSWAVGSAGAALFTCFVIFGICLTHRFSLGVAFVLVGGLWASWEGFKMFRSERNSN